MNWFAYQKSAGDPVPVTFDEHPRETPTMAQDVIWSTVRRRPEELRNASLADLAAWASAQ